MSSSETPRTDAELRKNEGGSISFIFARQLERELTAALAERDEARLAFNDIDLCKHGQAPCAWALRLISDRDAQKAGWDTCSLVCLRLERERNEARAALCNALDYYHGMWGDEAGTSWRNQDNERAKGWRKAAGL